MTFYNDLKYKLIDKRIDKDENGNLEISIEPFTQGVGYTSDGKEFGKLSLFIPQGPSGGQQWFNRTLIEDFVCTKFESGERIRVMWMNYGRY